jgi:hypothetical protein
MLGSPFGADGLLDDERRPYVEVAVTVSATLCEVPSFFETANILRHTPTFMRLALGSDVTVQADALRVVIAIAKHEHAREGLLAGSMFDELTRAVSEMAEKSPAFSILECLVTASAMPASHAVSMLGSLVRAMHAAVGATKMAYVALITSLFLHAAPSHGEELGQHVADWGDVLRSELYELLCETHSRISDAHRTQLLSLALMGSECVGVGWLLGGVKGKAPFAFATLLMAIIKVEVRVQLEIVFMHAIDRARTPEERDAFAEPPIFVLFELIDDFLKICCGAVVAAVVPDEPLLLLRSGLEEAFSAPLPSHPHPPSPATDTPARARTCTHTHTNPLRPGSHHIHRL